MTHQITIWWEDSFPYHVILRSGPEAWARKVIDCANWLEAVYPLLKGDINLSREDVDGLAWSDFDWGYSDCNINEGIVVFYFKDASVASHFKLVLA